MDRIRNYICPFFLTLLCSAVLAQSTNRKLCTVYGQVTAVSGELLSGAIVTLKEASGRKNLAFSITKNDGSFRLAFNSDSVREMLFVKVEMNGYNSGEISITDYNNCSLTGMVVKLMPSTKQLNEIIIKSQLSPVKLKGDTIEFNAKAYINPQTRKLQDLFANMQGFQVSADGKISYNGKEVEKILIEGEDLADKNYKLISRNLNAAWINKIQVLNNYNDDRLLKEVFQSDKIGINITVNEDVKNKLTGSLNAGAGTKSRVSADNSLIFLQEKIKWLSFLNYNNTGEEADADVGYLFNNDDPYQVSTGSDDGQILQTGRVFPPDLSNQYVRNNREFAGAAIASWKTGQKAKMKAMLSNTDAQLKTEAGELQQTFLPDGSQWLIQQRQRSLVQHRNWYGVISLNHDNRADNNGFLYVDGLVGKQYDQYANNVSGEINDNAMENLNGRNFALRAKGYETWKKSPGRVLTLSYSSSFDRFKNQFDAATARYIDYFKIDSTWVEFKQQLTGKIFKGSVEAGWFVRKKKIDYGLQSKSSFVHFDYLSQNDASDKAGNLLELASAISRITSFSNSLSGTSYKQINRRQSINLTMTAGLQMINVKTLETQIKSVLPVYNAAIKYSYSFKPTQFLHAQYQLTSGNQRFNMFYPDSMISGNASVMNPADTLVSPIVNRINLQFVSRNIYRASSLMATFSYSFASKEYMQTTDVFPSYIMTGYLPVSGNRHINLLVNAEQFISKLRMKFITQPSVMIFRTNTIINGLSTNNHVSNIKLIGKMITGFKWPLNLELSGAALYTQNKTRAIKGEWMVRSFWQYQASSKLKMQFSEKLYVAAVYQYMQFAKPNSFQTMDLFAQYIINSSVRFSVNAHNLFNSPALVQQFVTASQYGEQRFQLMKRYFLFKVDWSF
jgi:hypothetical protein